MATKAPTSKFWLGKAFTHGNTVQVASQSRHIRWLRLPQSSFIATRQVGSTVNLDLAQCQGAGRLDVLRFSDLEVVNY